MTETHRCIQGLTRSDPTPIAVPRGVVENLADNLELSLAGSELALHNAWTEYRRAVLETEPDDHKVAGENVVGLFAAESQRRA